MSDKKLGKFGKPVREFIPNDVRNYERRSIPELPGWTVTRDGDLQLHGHDEYRTGGILTDINGVRMTMQMFIHKAFPDIPMRETPTW